MANISITDQLQLSAGLTIDDNSAFAQSKLTKLSFASIPVVGDLAKPVDECSFRNANVGATVSSPAMLLANQVGLTISAGENATLAIKTGQDRQLFDDEDMSPDMIVVENGQCWVGLELATTLAGSIAVSVDGVGISLGQTNEVDFGTHVLFTKSAGAQVTLQQALKTLLEEFAIGATAAAVRNQPVSTVRTVGSKGTVQVSASYSLPVAINPLASASLPFQYELSVQPATTIQVSGSIALTGEFSTRSYRCDAGTLIFGLYKKKETTLSATFTAGAGVATELNGKDLLSPILNAVFGPPNMSVVQLDNSEADELKNALKSCVNQSFSVAMNACCSASNADEAAVVYSIDLTQSVEATDKAMAAALRGDWSAFEGLANAKQLRNIVKETKDSNHRIGLNLLGVYNATSIHDYVKSSAVLHDGNGQIVLVNETEAKSLAATDTPYAAKADKLRSALAQAFIATVSYGATGGSGNAKLALKSFTVRQAYLEFKLKPSTQDVRQFILLARGLNIPVEARWDALLQSNNGFGRAKCYIDAQYGVDDVLRIFYADPAQRIARTRDELDKIGCATKLALLDATSETEGARRLALSSPAIWKAMTDSGNPNNFRSIDSFSELPNAALGAISADYIDIRWWSDAMQKIPAKLTAVLNALDASTTGNPLQDKAFMARQKDLQSVLSDVTANTKSAFGDGWGLAVMHACAGTTAFVQMDLSCDNEVAHYAKGTSISTCA